MACFNPQWPNLNLAVACFDCGPKWNILFPLMCDPQGPAVEMTMHLKFDHFDGRSRVSRDIIDEDTGKIVGHIRSNGVGFTNNGGIEIYLFDHKYRNTVSSYPECRGFVLGVQSVLNHMTAATDRRAKSRETIAA